MLRSLKNLLIFSALVCYAATALVGQALHALPGCDHGLCCDDEHFQVFSAAGGPAGLNFVLFTDAGARHSRHEHASCPICEFQAQGQIFAMPVELGWVFQRPTYRNDESPGVVISDASLVYSSRAPPHV